MKLGACYNLFDAEELLEGSILSIKKQVDYVCVVYQKVSNWGNRCSPRLESFLQDLVERKLVDEIIFYEPQVYPIEKKTEYLSKKVSKQELGGGPESVSDVFYNELAKREIGRLKCKEAGCTHFMSMDTDEFYIDEELKYAKEQILLHDYDATACKMRIYFKEPIYEFFPYDEMNSVPLIYKIKENGSFRLASPYPILLDPTRRVEDPQKFHLFKRNEIEMHHYSFVRKSMRRKLDNVSNKFNYQDIEKFLTQFESWTVDKGVLHPHPMIGQQFKKMNTTKNIFNIDISQQCRYCCKSNSPKRCGKCKKAKYCGVECQKDDWDIHKIRCAAPTVTEKIN